MIAALKAEGLQGDALQIELASLDRARLIKGRAHTPETVFSLYKSYGLNLTDFQREMGLLGYSVQEVQALAEDAQTEREAELRIRALGQLKQRYLHYQIDNADLLSILTQLRLDAQQIAEVTSSWQVERGFISKELSASQLCKFFGDNLLSKEDYYDRLVAMGYSPVDAGLIAGDCELGNKAKDKKTQSTKAAKPPKAAKPKQSSGGKTQQQGSKPTPQS